MKEPTTGGARMHAFGRVFPVSEPEVRFLSARVAETGSPVVAGAPAVRASGC